MVKKACHIYTILLLDPKTFKMEVCFKSPDFNFFFLLIINTMEMECFLFTCLWSLKILLRKISSVFIDHFAGLRSGSKLILDGRFYFHLLPL